MNITDVPTARTAADVDAAGRARRPRRGRRGRRLVPSATRSSRCPATTPTCRTDATAAGRGLRRLAQRRAGARRGATSSQDALASGAAAGTPLALADALRPALEAAAGVLGAGVLEPARVRAGRAACSAADTQVVALQQDGVPVAWFALRVRGRAGHRADRLGRRPSRRSAPTCACSTTSR